MSLPQVCHYSRTPAAVVLSVMAENCCNTALREVWCLANRKAANKEDYCGLVNSLSTHRLASKYMLDSCLSIQ